ncbi:MAG: NAD(P)-dependent oxidoreductase [Loktanella sp.]|nr:NAD(P)-dependent oxidoreductase [Loktanella sp.]
MIVGQHGQTFVQGAGACPDVRVRFFPDARRGVPALVLRGNWYTNLVRNQAGHRTGIKEDQMAAEMEAAGMTLVDAPLGRTPKEAEEGTLDAMVGCDAATFAKVRPIIECWAGNINHVGGTGDGHRMKLVMNFISMGYAALYAEALTMGVKAGLAPQAIQSVIGGSRLSNGFFDTFMRAAVDRERDVHKFTITNAAKDTRYAAAMAMEAGMANPLGGAIRNAFAQMEAAGKGGDYVPWLADHVAALNGLDLEAAAKKG